MFKNIALILLMLVLLNSCTSKMNQYIKISDKVQKRHGNWKEENSADGGVLISVGKYKMGEKVGVWKTTFDGKIYQKDKIRKNITKTKLYFPNGKIMERGHSKLDISEAQRHWYYFGDWKYYDENGKIKYIKRYTDGKKTDSISFNQ